ncbi:MAG: hypothetical protein GXP27_16795 [Planctomycetes bacterium]|nr:hypothetical protein [Planctomycetota bacterium]
MKSPNGTRTGRIVWVIAAIGCLAWAVGPVGLTRAEVVRIEIRKREPFAGGYAFPRTGPYEKIVGRLYYEVDPENPANARITDLEYAPRNGRGRVEFWSDFFLLKPVDARRGNRRLLYDVHNRGNKLALWTFNEAPAGCNDPTTLDDAGNGFLMREGYTILWSGWCGEIVDDGKQRLLAGLPVARDQGKPITGPAYVEICVDEPVRSRPFFWSPWGVAAAYPSIRLDNADATLWMRPRRSEPRVEVPRSRWAFARWKNGRKVPDPTSLYLEDGFRPGWLYELVYTATNPRVSGLGLAGLRDCVSFFRFAEADRVGTANPLTNAIDRAYVFGISQSGRLVHHFLYEGFNADEAGRRVFDGAMIHVAGSGKGLFNTRFGMATVYGTGHWGDLYGTEFFPFAPVPQTDPVTGRRGDSLARLRASGHMPKVFFVQSSTEYWARAASLLHTDVEGKRDLPMDSNVRIYLIAGSQHLGGRAPTRGICQYRRNPMRHRPPILRALLVAMDRWASGQGEPPPSRYPRIDKGTLIDVATFRQRFPHIPGVRPPEACYTPCRLDFGPRWRREGIADILPPKVGPAYRTLVPAVDADGNELAGIRLPDIAVPLATYTGWNLRAAKYGAEGVLAGLHGAYFPFAATRAERLRTGDPRPSIAERYPTHEAYLTRVAHVVVRLQRDGFLLAEDAVQMLRAAAERSLPQHAEKVR